MEDKKTKRVVIDIYDADGVLTETVEGSYTFDGPCGIMDELQQIIANEGVPVVRDPAKAAQEKKPEDEPMSMTVRWKVNGVEFECCGPVEDVKHQELLFRSQLGDIIATTGKLAEGHLDRLDEMVKELLKQ